MNLYFLKEGKRTEPKVYPKWIESTFPQLTRACKVMACCPSGYSYSRKAHFHEAYLKEMLRERGLKYSKTHPGITTEKDYLDALRQRCETTGHLPSLKRLLDIWDAI